MMYARMRHLPGFYMRRAFNLNRSNLLRDQGLDYLFRCLHVIHPGGVTKFFLENEVVCL